MKKHKKSILFISIFLIAILTIFIVITYIYSSREKNFKANIRQAQEVRIVSGNTGEFILLSKEDVKKLANKIDTTDFKFILFPKQREGWSYNISYTANNDDWSMCFGGGFVQISHNDNRKSYQYNHDLQEYVETMYKELGGK